MPEPPFWKTKTLAQLSTQEWESLCDGCARCCLIKAEDDDTAEIIYTEVACRLLDLETCRCMDYHNRHQQVLDCIGLTPDKVLTLSWLPMTCAYRLVAEGRDLYWWHPLVSRDPETVHLSGASVRGRALPENDVGDPLSHIADWPTQEPAALTAPPKPPAPRRGARTAAPVGVRSRPR